MFDKFKELITQQPDVMTDLLNEPFYFESKAVGYHPNNAYSLARLAYLAYKEEETIIRLARVGFDKVEGYLKGGFEAWKKAAENLDLIIEVDEDEDLLDDMSYDDFDYSNDDNDDYEM